MSEIIEIKTEKHIYEYHQLCKYCFVDTVGWTDYVFPLPGSGSYALGIFAEAGNMVTGVISDRFTTGFFGTTFSSSGISAVISDPAVRNKGQVREIMNEILRKDYNEGVMVSYLYPFSYRFYNKFGYGYLNQLSDYEFKPEEINVQNLHCPGTFEPFEYREDDYRGLITLNNKWIEGFDGGITWPFLSMDAHKKLTDINKYKQYIYRGKDGTIKAFLKYFLTPSEEGGFKIDIIKSAWDSAEGLRAIFLFLWQHREHVVQIRLRAPSSMAVHLFMAEPLNHRMANFGAGITMVRPVIVEDLLRKKAEYQNFTGSLEFSIKDPVIEENSGTYIVDGNKITRKPYSGVNEIAFEVFSGLLMGGFSLEEAVVSGLIGDKLSKDYADFFIKNHNFFVSERF